MLDWIDIGYNFIVGEDGNVYEGRGWGINGAHSGKNFYNKNSLGNPILDHVRSESIYNECTILSILKKIDFWCWVLR